MYIEYIYGIISAILFTLATVSDSVILSAMFSWIGLSLLIIFVAYLTNQPNIFRKKSNGSIPLIMRLAFFPFMFGVSVYNKIQKGTDKKNKYHYIHHIQDDIYLSSRLSADEALSIDEFGIAAILDVTAEFDALDWSSRYLEIDYLNIPILDHKSPTPTQLRQALNWIDTKRRQNKPIMVHCALGRGRSLFCVAAYILANDKHLSVDEVLDQITSVRSQAGLNKSQKNKLQVYRDEGLLNLHPPAWLIANPVAGSAKWQKYRPLIVTSLSQHFNLNVVETTEDKNAQEWAAEAKKDDVSLIIAAGGDGTLAEVATELVNTDIKFGILPLGTANALAHSLFGISSKLVPIETALEHIIKGSAEKVDTAVCNGKTMLLVAALGLEEQMISKADRNAKNDLGQLAYLQGFWQSLIQNKNLDLFVQLDDKPATTIKTNSFVIANAAPFISVLAQGQGEPDYQDGLLNITWLENGSSLGDQVVDLGALMAAGLNLINTEKTIEDINSSEADKNGETSTSESIKTARVQKISIKAEEPIGYVVDGETYEDKLIKISVRPKSLNVLL